MLNREGDFFDAAFASKEQECIMQTKRMVHYYDEQFEKSEKAIEYECKVFLLDISEINDAQLFPDNRSKFHEPAGYLPFWGDDTYTWWLANPVEFADKAFCVRRNEWSGENFVMQSYVDSKLGCVPAIRIKL